MGPNSSPSPLPLACLSLSTLGIGSAVGGGLGEGGLGDLDTPVEYPVDDRVGELPEEADAPDD